MKKILAIILAVTFLLVSTGCSLPKKMFNIEYDAFKFENAGYETSVMTDSDEIYEMLEDTLWDYVKLGGNGIYGTDLRFSDCSPLFDSLPVLCEKITGWANHIKKYEHAPYEQMTICYFETPADAEQYFELFIPWFKIIQYSKEHTKEYTYGQKDNIVYICTIDAYDILMQNSWIIAYVDFVYKHGVKSPVGRGYF